LVLATQKLAGITWRGTDGVDVVTLNRTLDQELMALMRGASLECPACGEFVLHREGSIECPECGSGIRKEAGAALHLDVQAG
jgi:predicted RNA-binding Zn-ribbon protein involved in translation (DUF1610 family)